MRRSIIYIFFIYVYTIYHIKISHLRVLYHIRISHIRVLTWHSATDGATSSVSRTRALFLSFSPPCEGLIIYEFIIYEFIIYVLSYNFSYTIYHIRIYHILVDTWHSATDGTPSNASGMRAPFLSFSPPCEGLPPSPYMSIYHIRTFHIRVHASWEQLTRL